MSSCMFKMHSKFLVEIFYSYTISNLFVYLISNLFVYLVQKLSDQMHEENGEHNNDYDHEAFLGREEAKTFDQLTPEESKERLGYVTILINLHTFLKTRQILNRLMS